jgi:hypothetical protein
VHPLYAYSGRLQRQWQPKGPCPQAIKELVWPEASWLCVEPHLHAGLTEKLSFVQSQVDPCVYYRGTLVFLLYTDNSVLNSPDDSEIDRAMDELGKHFNITDQGQIED